MFKVKTFKKFRKFDSDDSGTIDTQELGNLIRVLGLVSCPVCKKVCLNNDNMTCYRLNPSDTEVTNLRKEIDDDGNGELDFDEFCQLMNSATLRKMQVT